MSEGLGIAEQLKIPWLGLRSDLLFHEGPLDPDGHHSWVVEDPVRGSNFRLGVAESKLFRCLRLGNDLDDAAMMFYRETSLRPDPSQIVAFIDNLQRNQLTRLPADYVIEEAEQQELNPPPQKSWAQRAMHGYVYFRVPLLKPDSLLAAMLPWVRWLWAPFMRLIYLAMSVAGLLLALPQAELYFSTASFLFTAKGAVIFAVCLALLKICHEFSHALTAKSLGLHVRTMGVAFIVMWPILYTDTSDSWKLDDRRLRRRIDVAGMLFELVVAGIALFVWALVPDGVLRSLMFFLSSTSLASSLFVNINPFMSFDGYYILMDVWGIDNLRPRATALMKHRFRRVLFDWRGKKPEQHPKEKAMIWYAMGASLYRIVITLSIALAVYHLYFKALGTLLLLVELWVFLLRPVYIEFQYVFRHRELMGSRLRLLITSLVFIALVTVLAVPTPRIETLPALVLYEGASPVSAPHAGRLEGDLPAKGSRVYRGESLLLIRNDEVAHEREQARFELDQLDARLETIGSAGEAGGYRNWLLVERRRLLAQLDKLDQLNAQMEVLSPIDGMVVDRNPDMYAGAWVAKDTSLLMLAHVADRGGAGSGEARDGKEKGELHGKHIVKAYVHEQIDERMPHQKGLRATLHFPNLELPVVDLVLRKRGTFPVNSIPNDSLYDRQGGGIVSRVEDDKVMPRVAHLPYTFDVFGLKAMVPHGTPCEVWVEGASQSVIGDAVDSLGRILAEEGLI